VFDRTIVCCMIAGGCQSKKREERHMRGQNGAGPVDSSLGVMALGRGRKRPTQVLFQISVKL